MAEKSAPVLTEPHGSRDHEEIVGKNLEKEKNNDRCNPCGNEDRPMNDKLEKGKMMKDQSADDISSDEDEIPLENENTLLTRYKEQLKQAREGGPTGLPSEDTTAPPNLNLNGQVSYANTAAQATVTKVVVGSSGARILGIKLKSRPRSVIVHGPEIGPYSLSVRYDGQSQTCRKCNEVGHMARECQVKRCFNCGDPGHLNVDCESERICQGCGSPDHKLEKCPVSWEPEDGDDGSESMISDEGSDGGDGDEGSVGREGEDGRNDEATPAIQNQTEGVSHGLETSAAGQENRSEVDSPIPESLFNQCASDWGSLCETLAEKRLPNQDERLDIKNSGAVDLIATP
eukprot:Seg3137.1 transcript_id=Seg3137.1/GoldUCD/mRNA.D3Y31 product="Zinc finger CCHC domain-containing protein 3" protein_id=Seg3137.1/GoldUCD/D3Y31